MKNKIAGAHTPGPWRIGDAGFTVFGPPNGQPAPEMVVTGKNRENIRLCAAAPELLEALEAVCAHTAKYAPIGTGGGVWSQARAAIAKAKGE